MKNVKKWLVIFLAVGAVILAGEGFTDAVEASAEQRTDAPRGLPNVSTRTQNSGRVDVFADFLFWFASEEPASVWANVFSVGSNTSTFEPKDFEFDWSCGFRLGAGYNFAHDQWDTQLYWTWFRTQNHDSASPKPSSIVLPEFEAGLLSRNDASGAHIHWTIQLNMIDWELGRKYWVSKALCLRPFIGLKGGWIDQSLSLRYEDLIRNNVTTNNNGKERLKNDFWGIGPVGGLNTQWKLRDFGTHFPSLLGDFSVATMWGTWKLHDRYRDTTGLVSTTHFKTLALGAIMFRGFVGAGWDVQFCRGRCRFATSLGYEMQLWVNQLRLSTLQLLPLHGDLTLQGITWNSRFDF
ncbi:MAG: hypothetical protein JSR39_09555 [Verrucomicrobia bacterium]|nr:hypothetical protein [Verrucomicrobiota bacterium]